MTTFVAFMVFAYLLNIILIVVLVCFERRDPVVSLAWVLGFTLLPIIGAVIFLVFGQGIKRKTANLYAKKWRMNLDLSEKLTKEQELFDLKKNPEGEFSDTILYLLNTNNSVYTDCNSVQFYTDAKDKYAALLKDIQEAQETIHLLYFIIRDDQISNTILKALCEKARQGVEVRFLYDDFGSLLTSRRIFHALSEAGGKVCAFFPLKFGSYSKINHRNHRKIVVIDGKIGYLGGMNIGDEYMGMGKLSTWRDTHMRIIGPAVKYLQKSFALDWAFSANEDLSTDIKKFFSPIQQTDQNVAMQIVASGPDSTDEEIKCGMIKIMNNANYYLYIQTPYFVPDKAFLNSLVMAAKSGVDVRVMIPGVPDKNYVYYTTMSYVGELLSAGIRVFTYPGFLHSKTIVSDDRICTVGTTNIDIRSFQLHFEINAFMYNVEKSIECRRTFLKDQEVCSEITLEFYQKRGIWQQMKEGFFRLFSQIM